MASELLGNRQIITTERFYIISVVGFSLINTAIFQIISMFIGGPTKSYIFLMALVGIAFLYLARTKLQDD